MFKTEPYSPEKTSAYDQKTYMGRMLHFIRFTSPRNALYTNQQIMELKAMLEDHAAGKLNKQLTDKELWDARYAVVSNLHSDTGEPIPRLFRMSYFVPCNIPIAIGLSISAPTTFNVILWQWINQSYNFGVNLANANATNATDNKKIILTQYLTAVISSISIGLLTKRFVARSKWKDNLIFQRLTPFMGVAGANTVNLFASRYMDTIHGIKVRDEKTDETLPQVSKKAGAQSFWKCAFSRVMIPLPVSFIPQILINFLRKIGKMPKSTLGNHAFNIGISGFILMVALPLSLAAFPQDVVVHKSKLEPEFSDMKNSKGENVEFIVFNRGL